MFNVCIPGSEISNLQLCTQHWRLESHDCVLSPLRFTLYTHECTPCHQEKSVEEYVDDTTITGHITNNDVRKFFVSLVLHECTSTQIHFATLVL